MSTITIDGDDYIIYDDLILANKYNKLALGTRGQLWKDADDDKKGTYLVNARMLIDRQSYIGSAATFDLRNAIEVFREASYEIATMLMANPDIMTQVTSGSNIKRVAVDGGPSVTYFNPTLGISGKFDQNIMDLIGAYLASNATSGTSGSFSSGTDGTHTSIDQGVPEPSITDLTQGLP